jgi:hypothetical protein
VETAQMAATEVAREDALGILIQRDQLKGMELAAAVVSTGAIVAAEAAVGVTLEVVVVEGVRVEVAQAVMVSQVELARRTFIHQCYQPQFLQQTMSWQHNQDHTDGFILAQHACRIQLVRRYLFPAHSHKLLQNRLLLQLLQHLHQLLQFLVY